MKKLAGCLLLGVLLAACNTLNIYEKSVFFQEHAWKSTDRPSFRFDITDTTSLYHIYLIIRHTDAYHFNNIWLKVTTLVPGDTAKTQQVNARLADNKKGWLGTGMDDIFDHRIRLTRLPLKLKKGSYTFILQQDMREDPLQNILNAGIRVEKLLP